MEREGTDDAMEDFGRQIGELREEMREGFGSVRSEIGGLRSEINTRFDGVERRFNSVDRKFDSVHASLSTLWASMVGGLVALVVAFIVTHS
jgi:hypothetical protein